VLAPAAMAKLEARLREMAEAESGAGAARQRFEADRSKLAAVERKIATVGRNMALAETAEERAATAGVFRELQMEAVKLRAQVQTHRPSEVGRSPEREVEAALAGLDRLAGLGKSEDQTSIGELFRRLDVRLYLRFRATERGGRKINQVGGGVVTFGATPPPSRLYDGPTDRAIIRQKLASGEPVSSVADPVVPRISPSDPEVNWSANVQRGTSLCSGPGDRPRFVPPHARRSVAGPLSLVVKPTVPGRRLASAWRPGYARGDGECSSGGPERNRGGCRRVEGPGGLNPH